MPPTSSSESLACDHGLRRQTIVQSLLSQVFQGRLEAGQHLVTQKLAEHFGVSHTPIREALISLAGLGIVDLLPNRGAIVRPVTPRDIKEICQVRRVLECQATRTACGRIAPAILQSLADDLRQLIASNLTPANFIESARAIDSRLHHAIAVNCGNAFLAKELSRLKILFQSFREVSYREHVARNDHARLVEEAHEHLAIVEALIATDPLASARAMARHIRSGIRNWSRAMPANKDF